MTIRTTMTAAILVLAFASHVEAQGTSGATGSGADASGTQASATVARSEANLKKAERQADVQRRADEVRYRRRDDSMKKSLRGICQGC